MSSTAPLCSPPLRGSEFDDLTHLADADALERLAVVRAQLEAWQEPGVLAALAQGMPARVATLAPEVALALQEIAHGLAPHGLVVPEDVWLPHALPPRLRVAWLRTALVARPSEISRLVDEPTLLAVAYGWQLEGLPGAQPVLAHLAAARDPRLRLLAVRAVPAAVQHLALTGLEAFECVAPLAEADPDPVVRCEALALLSQPWLLGLPLQALRRREALLGAALRAPDVTLATAAVEAAAELALREPLAQALADDDAPSVVRAKAMEALGLLARDEDLERVLALAQAEPLGWGSAARGFLLAAHRHGVFLRHGHVPAVLALFDAHAGWTGDELWRVAYLARHALIDHLAALPADDARWIRRAEILAASHGAGAPRVLSALLWQLDPSRADRHVALAVLDAAGRSPEFSDEPALLRWLPHLPEVALSALRAKGGPAAVAPLQAMVGDPFTTPTLRTAALEVLWALAPDRPALLGELVQVLPPSELPLTKGRFAAQRDGSLAALLVGAPAHQAALDALDQLRVFCDSGQLAFLPEVTRLFREVLRGYVRKALEGDFSIKRLLLPELEQLVFRYGRHVLKDGRPVRRWVAQGPETGRDLLLLMIIDWLAEEPSDPLRVALLEIAARHAPEGAYLRSLERHWRKGDANVRRAAIELLAAAAGRARGLELSLGRLLVEEEDPRLLTQALAALGSLQARWAEPAVRAALERPEMAVKKAAAEALADIATTRSVPALVGYLARHDNESFRAALQRALVKAAGPSLVAVVVEELERQAGAAAEPRAVELLWQVLSSRLPLHAVLQLARSQVPAHRALVEACVDGRVTVAGASPEQVAAALHRARLRPRAAISDPARRLRVEGFSVEAAQQLLAELAEPGARGGADLRAAAVQVVREGLASWLTWLAQLTPPSLSSAGASGASPSAGASPSGHAPLPLDALLLVLAAAGPGELAAPTLALAERWHARLASERLPGAIAGFIERAFASKQGEGGPDASALRMRALTLVRALAPSSSLGGLRRFSLLGNLGALRTLADLQAALDECRLRPSSVEESFQLLCEAFAIPRQATPREPEALTALRDQARGWSSLSPAAQRAWLAQLGAERPLELPTLPDAPSPPPRPPFHASSQEDLAALLSTLQRGPAQERSRAAQRLLAWPDARPAWPAVLAAYLKGEVEVDDAGLARLAGALARWPELGAPEERGRAAALLPHLAPWQRRSFVPQWLRAWEQGEWTLSDWLVGVGQEVLLPFVAERVRQGNPAAAELLRPSRSFAMQALLVLLDERAPREAARLRKAPTDAPAEGASDPVDPLEGASLDELLRQLADKRVEKGLAVRAVHALLRFEERSVAPLSQLAIDRRPPIRSAALRALRAVASREHTLAVTTQVLAMETRRDVTLQLLASLGHGRHLPALPELLERVIDRDPRIRRGAIDALRAWGHDVVPAVEHVARRARPDKRRQYEALLTELEAGSDDQA